MSPRPELVCETSIPALIGGVVMPSAHFYVRNHFQIPKFDSSTWRLDVGGLVERPLSLSLRDLRNMPSQSLVVTLECAGNGRSLLEPPVEGEKWALAGCGKKGFLSEFLTWRSDFSDRRILKES